MLKRSMILIVIFYGSWLGMMAVHESGHAIAGWLTGGHVQRINIPLWGFSRTDVLPNPNRVIEVWGGPVWGCIAPLLMVPMIRKPCKLASFFAGFCLVANGSYLAVGWTMHAGDAWELVQLGSPRFILATVGGVALACGLFIWHRLDSRLETAESTDTKDP